MTKDEQTLRLIAAYLILYPAERDKFYDHLICIAHHFQQEKSPA